MMKKIIIGLVLVWSLFVQAQSQAQTSEEYYQLGLDRYLLKEDLRGALQAFNKAIELNPKYASAYESRAHIKGDLKEHNEAILDYDKTIEIDPQNKTVYFNRGLQKSSIQDYMGAMQDYNRVIELDPKFRRAYNSRAIIKIYLGDKMGACLDWSKAGELGDMSVYDSIKKHCN